MSLVNKEPGGSTTTTRHCQCGARGRDVEVLGLDRGLATYTGHEVKLRLFWEWLNSTVLPEAEAAADADAPEPAGAIRG